MNLLQIEHQTGWQAGILEGKREGKREAKQTIAVKMLKQGFPLNIVASITGLSVEMLNTLT